MLSHTVLQNFMDTYSASMIAKAQASGASPQVVQAKIAEIEHMKEMYANPLYQIMMTFIEPFPIGLLITLISAGVLRRKARQASAQTAATA